MNHRVVTFAIVAAASNASAQPAGAQAEVLFREGRELLAAGKIAEACTAFEQSQKLEPATTTLINLAGCRERNNQLATAWGLFLDVERQTRSATDDASQKLHEVAFERAQKLESRVSKLKITVAESPIDGLEITRGNDRVDAAMWNRMLPIDGGTYKFTARAPGMGEWSEEVTVGIEKDSRTVEVPKLTPLPKPATTPTTETNPNPKQASAPSAETSQTPSLHDTSTRPHGASMTVPLVIGAGALVLGGIALAFELDAESTYDQAKAETSSQSRRDSLYDSANTRRYVAEGLAVGGLACAGAAVWLYLHGRHVANDHTAIVPTANGLGVVGRF